VISQAAGSAYVEFDATKVMCGVYGPRQGSKTASAATTDRGRLDVDVRLAAFATPGERGAANRAGDAERDFAGLLQRALEGAVMAETFPKTSVDVYVTVLEASGAEFPAACAAASAALADAGVAMLDLVAACAVARVPTSKSLPGDDATGGDAMSGGAPGGAFALLLDPTAEEEAKADGGVVVAATGRAGEATQLVATGRWDGDQLDEAIQLAASGCARVDEAIRDVLRAAAGG
jgi:exosome complex component MTR3